MAFDKRQLQTCKQLEQLLKVPQGVEKSHRFHSDRLKNILVRFGRFYATNYYSLVRVEWNEYQHAGDYEWQVLKRYADDEGKLLFKFELKPMDNPFVNDDIFEKQFLDCIEVNEPLEVNPALLINVLKVFKINRLTPIIVHDGTRYELSAHNDDVSIKAIVMGIRR